MNSSTALHKKRANKILTIGVVFMMFIIVMFYVSKSIQYYLLPAVDYEKSSKGYIEEQITLDGFVQMYNEKLQTAMNSYKILSLCVQAGDTVEKGDVLFKFDKSEYEIEIKKKELQKQKLLLDIQENNKAFESSISLLEDEITFLIKQIEKQEETVKKAESLYISGVESLSRVNELKSKLNLDKREYEIKVKELEKKMNEDMADSVAQKRMEISIYQDEIEKLKEALALNGEIKSEFSGVVNHIFVHPGEKASSGQVLIKFDTLKETATIECEIEMDAAAIVQVDEEVFVEFDEYPEYESKGIITSKEILAEKQKVLIICSFTEKENIHIYDQQKAKVRYTTRSEYFKIIIPKRCIVNESGKNYVFILEYDESITAFTAKKTEVKVIKEAELECAIIPLNRVIKPDDLIISESSNVLSDNLSVRIKGDRLNGAEN